MNVEIVYEIRYSNDYGYLGGSKYGLNKQALIDCVLPEGYELSDDSKFYARFSKGEFEYADFLSHNLLK